MGLKRASFLQRANLAWAQSKSLLLKSWVVRDGDNVPNGQALMVLSDTDRNGKCPVYPSEGRCLMGELAGEAVDHYKVGNFYRRYSELAHVKLDSSSNSFLSLAGKIAIRMVISLGDEKSVISQDIELDESPEVAVDTMNYAYQDLAFTCKRSLHESKLRAALYFVFSDGIVHEWSAGTYGRLILFDSIVNEMNRKYVDIVT